MVGTLPFRAVAGSALPLFALLSLLALLLSACGGPTTPSVSAAASRSSPPSASPSAAPSPSVGGSAQATTVDTPDEAAALVLATDPRFTGLAPQDPDRIGACCYYSAIESGDVFSVIVEIGWGDCPAGCIDRHRWFFTVTRDGTVHPTGEDGPPVPAGVPGPGGGTTGGDDGVPGIRGLVTARPVCPVVRPDDPACADRPVAGALIHVLDVTGTEVAVLETDANGAFLVALPAGRYSLRTDPVEGFLGAPAIVEVAVEGTLVDVTLPFDTGIR